MVPPIFDRTGDFANWSCSSAFFGNKNSNDKGSVDNNDVTTVSFHKPSTLLALIASLETSHTVLSKLPKLDAHVNAMLPNVVNIEYDAPSAPDGHNLVYIIHTGKN